MQVFYDEPKCFDSFMAHYEKFSDVSNYIAIVGTKQDWEKAGYSTYKNKGYSGISWRA